MTSYQRRQNRAETLWSHHFRFYAWPCLNMAVDVDFALSVCRDEVIGDRSRDIFGRNENCAEVTFKQCFFTAYFEAKDGSFEGFQ
jgi:hypothetical protein